MKQLRREGQHTNIFSDFINQPWEAAESFFILLGSGHQLVAGGQILFIGRETP